MRTIKKINRKRFMNIYHVVREEHVKESAPDKETSNKKVTNTPKPSITITETVFLAATPLLAYGISYAITLPYFAYFGIPIQLMDFNLQEIFVIVFLLILGAFGVLSLLDFVYVTASLTKSRIFSAQVLIHAAILLLFLLIFIYIPNIEPSLKYFVIVVFGLLIFAVYILPFFTKGKKTYLEEFESRTIATYKDDNKHQDLFDIVLKKVDSKITTVGLLYLILLIFILTLGEYSAKSKTTFDIITDGTKCAVIYTTKDRIICLGEIDFANKTFENSYRIYSVNDLTGKNFAKENIGPLHPKPTPINAIVPMSTNTYTPLPSITPMPTSVTTIFPTAIITLLP